MYFAHLFFTPVTLTEFLSIRQGDSPQSGWEMQTFSPGAGFMLQAGSVNLAPGRGEHSDEPPITEMPSCWSRAVWGVRVVTEADSASSSPAPHTAPASVAGAPGGRRPHPCWTDVTAGAPGAKTEDD